MTLMICKGNDGTAYVHYAHYDEIWREGSVCKVKEGSIVHTAYFDSDYQAAIFMRFAEYDELIEYSDEDNAKMLHCFLTEVWSPSDMSRCWAWVMKLFRHPNYFAQVSVISRYTDVPNLFLDYVIEAMVEVGYIFRYGDLIMTTDIALINVLKQHITNNE